MIDSGIYNPVLAYCRERIKQAPTVEAKAELASVIVLCEGLQRSQEMIQKALKRNCEPAWLNQALNEGNGSYKP